MDMISLVLILLVAILHFYFLYLEMFAFTKAKTLKTFGISKEKAEASKEVAANQGLYNGFMAAGLIWSVLYPSTTIGYQIALFFLSCIVIAAIYGAVTVTKKILFVQGFPAVLGLIAILVNI
ncbi:DUF1304 domain-containing protein [Bacillus sp. JJ664]